MPIPIRSANLRDCYTEPYRLSHQNRLESDPMVSLVLWDISTQGQQECVALDRSGNDVTGVSGSGRRSGELFY